MIRRLCKTLAAMIPGTGANLAQRKRRMEDKLHAQGYSRSHARALVAEYFGRKQTR